MDSVDSTGSRCVGGGESYNPFLVSMELTAGATELAAGGAAAHPKTALLSGTWPPTPPPSALTNPFRTPAKQDGAAGSESMVPPQYCYDGPGNMVSTPAVAVHYSVNNDFKQTFDGRPANPFSPANNVYASMNPSTLAHTPASQPAVSPFTPCMSQSVRHIYAERAHGYYSAPPSDAPFPRGREQDSGGYSQHSWRRADVISWQGWSSPPTSGNAC